MSAESIPLSFDAVDNLSKGVAAMTAQLIKMGAAQDDTTQATEDATKATGEQAKATSKFGDVLVKVNAGVELAKSAYEALGGTIEWVREGLNTSLEKWDEQSKKLGVSASALGSISEANAKLEKSQGKVYASIGKIIDRSGVLQTKAILQSEALKELNTWLKENEESLSTLIKTYVSDAFGALESFGQAIQDNSESIGRYLIYLENFQNLFKGIYYTGETLAKWLRTEFYAAVAVVTTGVSIEIGRTVDALEAAALFLGTDIPQALKNARDSSKTFSEYMQRNTIESLVDTKDSAVKAGKAFYDFGATLYDVSFGTPAGLKALEERIDGVGEAAIRTGKRGAELLKTTGKGKGRKDLIDAETAAEEKRQTVLLDYDRRILEATKAQNDELVIQLTKEKALVEARQSLKDIKTKELRDATLTVAELQAQLDYEQSLKDLAQKRRDERAAAHDIEMQERQEILAWDQAQDDKARERYELAIARIQGRYDRETELLVGMGDLVSGALGHVPDLLNEISESTSRMVGGFGKAASGISPLITSMRNFNKVNATAKDQQDAINAGLQAGVGILGGVTEAFVEDKRKQAGIEALINAAAAAASYATGNIPAGIGYTAAAVTYGAAAAFGGGSAPATPTGASGASSGGSSGASSFGMIDLDRERSLNAEAIAEAMRSEGRGGAIQYNVNLSGAIIAGESPESARIITDLIIRNLENEGFRRD